jgi:hypothetical protein
VALAITLASLLIVYLWELALPRRRLSRPWRRRLHNLAPWFVNIIAAALGFDSVNALQAAIGEFCEA